MAGIVLALASFKPHVVFLLPIAMIAARRWRMLGVFLSTVAALLLVSLGVVFRYAVLVPWLYFVPAVENLGLIGLDLASMSGMALWPKRPVGWSTEQRTRNAP